MQHQLAITEIIAFLEGVSTDAEDAGRQKPNKVRNRTIESL